MVAVREVGPDEWETLRDVRLAALREAPYAFGSTYAQEAAFTEQNWRDRLTSRSVTFFAGTETDPKPVGLVGVYEEDGTADLVSMWVRPSVRGQRIGDVLITASANWTRARGYSTLCLWVTHSNTAARKLYARCGFIPTGESQPLPSSPSLLEIRMRRPL
jgi:ribosomal protein S18 acetylase RimI-like enzyme